LPGVPTLSNTTLHGETKAIKTRLIPCRPRNAWIFND